MNKENLNRSLNGAELLDFENKKLNIIRNQVEATYAFLEAKKTADAKEIEDDNKKNLLDRLEDFWLNIDRSYYYLCYDCDKGLGMNNSCKTCVNYQKTGNFCIY